MNKETVEGRFDQVAGKLKVKVGEAVGNQKLANAGVAEQVKGVAKETWGKVKDTAGEVHDANRAKAQVESSDLKHRAEAAAHDVREKIASTAQNVKDKVYAKLDRIKHGQRHV